MMMLIWIAIIGLIIWFINDRFIGGKDLPPGPLRLPFIGNIIQYKLWSKKVPEQHVVLQNFSKMYGPVAFLKLGFLDQVVVDDLELIRQVLQGDNWGQRPISEFILERSDGKSLGVLWSRGEMHKELRRFTLRTLRDFGFGKQKSQEAVMEEELTELMTRLDSKLENEGPTVKMQQFFTISILNILWSMMAGIRLSHDDPEFQKLCGMINKTMRLLTVSGNIMLAFPFLRHILPKVTGYGKVRTESLRRLKATFREILNERRLVGLYKDEQRDFIDVFLNEIDKHQDDPLGQMYNEEQFEITVMDLFVAGSETTANSLEFAILYMIHYPEVQEKIREEIDRVVGRSRFPNFLDKPNMPYSEAATLEVLRLSSVVSLNGRAPLQDTMIGKYPVKKETFTVLNLYSIHRNPSIWKEPEKFDPTRFLDSSNKIVNTDKIFPFGQGKRMCLGEVQARASLFTFLVTLLQNYTFEKSPDHPDPVLDGQSGLTLSPHPYFAVIKRRNF